MAGDEAVLDVASTGGELDVTLDHAAVSASSAPLTVGVEEEFHVVDLDSRELVPRGPEILERLPADSFTAELHRSMVETNSDVFTDLEDLRAQLLALRRRAADVAAALGLGIAAVGTVPLVEAEELRVTKTSRFEQMLDDYQLLAREQLICGTQIHIGLGDRDTAVAVAQRVSRWLPVLLALSASSPYWMGEDSGYASVRSLLWQRWPTAGASGLVQSATDHDDLVAELISSGTITDRRMIYFDVRPSAHVPTLELRVTDSCPDVDDIVLLAGLYRALVLRERDAVAARRPLVRVRGPVLRATTWRAARSGLEGELVDLTDFARPVPARDAVRSLVDSLRAQLEVHDDWAQISELADRAVRRGSAAFWQRRVYARRERYADVVDAVLTATCRQDAADGAVGREPQPLLAGYRRRADHQLGGAEGRTFGGDEVIAADGRVLPPYGALVEKLEQLGPTGLRERERTRDAEQRAHNMTFRVSGQARPRLYPFDVVPRIVSGHEWDDLSHGLIQRARALNAFLRDVYDQREIVGDGVVPGWVIDGAPGLLPLAALIDQPVRAHVAGMDLIHDASGNWHVLEDNLRVPSGMGYAVANRRLSQHIWPDLERPAELLDVEATFAALRDTLRAAAPNGTSSSEPNIVLVSSGPSDSAWFEHELLSEAMDIPVVRTSDLIVHDRTVYLRRNGVRRTVDVIYLRMDDDDLVHATGADGRPLGPSLLTAVASGTVALANAPGNGIGDDKAVYAFVPQMIDYYLGEQPLLGHVPTYLCGDPDHRAHVLDRLDELVVKPVDGYGGEGVVIGSMADNEEIDAIRRQIRAAPHRWIAQEIMRLSTHPVFDGNRLSPRHIDLRAFVLHGDQVQVTPAALTRVAPEGSLVVNSSRGGGAKDTWIVGGDADT
ncbi:MAG: carboxylate--amine ligase/circularly permuted type 2 ATP-grasp protein [Actinobacteria bacterium]|nr:carboxylate--amine ligase/circularly permuted type 2 ATP-grasp protein [Actinomycetota bacterium]